MYNINMDIYNKCSLIEEFVRDYSKYEFAFYNEDFLNFKMYNDLGIPLAQSVIYGLAELTDEGKSLLEETWFSFCTMVEADPDGEYESIYDMGYTQKDE